MSSEASAIALNHSRARGAAKVVLLGIANHDGDGGSWPSMNKLATYANVDPRSVQRAIESLVRMGEIEVHTNGGGLSTMADHMRPNLYTFLLRCPPNCDRTKAHRMLCIVCGKTLPTNRWLKLTHNACHPLTPASPPDASVTGPLTPASPELNPEPLQDDHSSTYVPKREEEDASGDSHQPANAIAASERCPRRLDAPHAYSKAGVCIDCGAPADTTTGDQP